MKRNVLFAILALCIFSIGFIVVWKIVSVFVEDIPGLTFTGLGLSVIISGALTGCLIRDLMSVPQKD